MSQKLSSIFHLIEKSLFRDRQFEKRVDSSPAILRVTQRDGSCSYLSKQWYLFTGQTENEALGFGWMERLHPSDREHVKEVFEQATQEQKPFQIEYRVLAATGKYRWVMDVGNPQFDRKGEFDGFTGAAFDFHETMKSRQSLKREEERFRTFAEVMPQMAFIADACGNILYFNQRHYDYFGIPRKSEEGWSWVEQDLHHPDDLNAVIQRWRESVETGKSYQMEYRLRRHDGEYRWHLGRAEALRDENGNVIRWLGTNTDIHAQKCAVEEMAKAKQAAEEANRSKSEFLANMSHEIRSPMNLVLGYADLLTEKDMKDSDRLAYALRIKSSGEHLLNLLDDILDLSKVEAGQLRVEVQKFSAVDTVEECVDALAILAEKKGLQIEVNFETPVPRYIKSDPTRFRQILMNLIGNAIKFTEIGVIRVNLRYQEKRVDSLRPSCFIVEVEDTGIGISPDKQDELFQPFMQADSSITRVYGGTGLGLHLSRKLAQALGGNLHLTWSAPGLGSCFTFSVDVGEGVQSPFVQELRLEGLDLDEYLRQDNGHMQGTKVLLVDDSPDNLTLMEIYLKKWNIEIETAHNGAEAIEKALSGKHDIVLMDIMMPVVDGFEATRMLRSKGYKTPIVALTAHALKDEIEESLQAGCDFHLAKPVSQRDLMEVLKTYCRA